MKKTKYFTKEIRYDILLMYNIFLYKKMEINNENPEISDNTNEVINNIEEINNLNNSDNTQEKENNRKNKVLFYSYVASFLVIIVVVLIFYFISWWKNNQAEKNIEENNSELSKILPLINSWDYDKVISYYEKIWTWKLDNSQKKYLALAYLNHWNYFHNETEKSAKTLELLNSINEKTYDYYHYKGYANEIIKNYTWAIESYNEWLKIKWINDEQKSFLLNQLWHTYDLSWNLDKAFDFYNKAYLLNKNNANSIWNLARYYNRMKDYKKSETFLLKLINLTEDLPLKSETYFSLSMLEYYLNWLDVDIEKSIDYAKKWIEAYPQYYMNYLALAKGYYMKNDKSFFSEIESNIKKAIELNPEWSYSYELDAMYEYEKWNFNKAYELFEFSAKKVDKDMILMDNYREDKKSYIYYKSHIFYQINEFKNQENAPISSDFDRILKIEAWKSILKEQLQRSWFWILSFLSQKNRDYIISNLNN